MEEENLTLRKEIKELQMILQRANSGNKKGREDDEYELYRENHQRQ